MIKYQIRKGNMTNVFWVDKFIPGGWLSWDKWESIDCFISRDHRPTVLIRKGKELVMNANVSLEFEL